MSYLKISMALFQVYFFSCFIGTHDIHAQTKQVEVDFQILENNYRIFYGDSIEDIQEKGKTLIAARLQQRFPFVKFGLQPGISQLLFVVDRQQTGLVNPLIHQVDLTMQLITAGNPGTNKITFEFRSADRFDEPLPNTNDAFLQELDFVMDFWLEKEQDGIVREVLSFISLADKALPDSQNRCWIMPFGEDSLLIGSESEFIVKSKLITPDIIRDIKYETIAAGKVQPTSTNYPLEYRGKILASLKMSAHSDIDKMTHSGLKVEGIYLTKFIRAVLSEPIPPEHFILIEN